MGMFSSNNSSHKLMWCALESIIQLNEVMRSSRREPIVLFKHSTRCGISTAALNRFESQWSLGSKYAQIYLLDLLNHRDVSNEIADLTGVTHQSPQVIVVKEESVIYHASHGRIDASEIESLLNKG